MTTIYPIVLLKLIFSSKFNFKFNSWRKYSNYTLIFMNYLNSIAPKNYNIIFVYRKQSDWSQGLAAIKKKSFIIAA